MDILEAIESRHSVRSYLDTPIPGDVEMQLQEAIARINEQTGLHFALFTQEPTGFAGKLKNVKNYIVFAGKDEKNLEERIGYYGAQIMLTCQMLGLNSCWVAMSFNKAAVNTLLKLQPGERVVNALAIGYGVTQGRSRRTKPMEKLGKWMEPAPEWFLRGMQAAMLAPTAINQQQFVITLEDETVTARAKFGPCNRIDLGIVKYFFEVGAGRKVFDL